VYLELAFVLLLWDGLYIHTLGEIVRIIVLVYHGVIDTGHVKTWGLVLEKNDDSTYFSVNCCFIRWFPCRTTWCRVNITVPVNGTLVMMTIWCSSYALFPQQYFCWKLSLCVVGTNWSYHVWDWFCCCLNIYCVLSSTLIAELSTSGLCDLKLFELAGHCRITWQWVKLRCVMRFWNAYDERKFLQKNRKVVFLESVVLM